MQLDKFRNGISPPLMRGIYEVKGDVLRMCMTSDPKADRPQEFKADSEGKYRLDVYRRRKSQ